MPTKGQQTRRFIQSTAKQLFSQKGYAVVTMKDICDASGLSRGGLYRHFGSTREIMLAILTEDKTRAQESLERALQKGIPATQLLHTFLQSIKADIQSGENRFYFAVHEFAFIEPSQSGYMQSRFESAVTMLSTLLRHGQQTGEYKAFDAPTVAAHITFCRDSLVTASASLPLSETLIDRQLTYLRNLVIEDEP